MRSVMPKMETCILCNSADQEFNQGRYVEIGEYQVCNVCREEIGKQQENYKVLSPDGEPLYGGTGKWNLPKDGKPGDWMPPIDGELKPCENGYHICTVGQLPAWVWRHCAVYEVEPGEEKIHEDEKIVCRTARLTHLVGIFDRKTAVRWACDCAEHVLPIFEKERQKDDRPRKAIETTRRWLDREASITDWYTAARAANAAARVAVYVAARAAAHAAYAAANAANAAANAAHAARAADDAAYAADAAAYPTHAAHAAEREWQGKRLVEILEREE